MHMRSIGGSGDEIESALARVHPEGGLRLPQVWSGRRAGDVPHLDRGDDFLGGGAPEFAPSHAHATLRSFHDGRPDELDATTSKNRSLEALVTT